MCDINWNSKVYQYFLNQKSRGGWWIAKGGGRPAPPPPSYFLGVSKEVIKYLVSVTAHQLLTLLIFDTFVNFNKYYKMSVSKLERDKLSSVLSRRLLLNWWIDWAQTFRIFFLLIETYIKLSFLQSNRLGYQSVCLCVSLFSP